tara:strand:+ start:57 stop:473 length:417 start_codon:yes stop_codon:yes gene_type:complete
MENVSALINRGLSDVLGSLAQVGYNAEWTCITASMFGAPHKRERVFIVAYSNSKHIKKQSFNPVRMEKTNLLKCECCKNERLHIGNYWEETPIESGLCSLDDGISERVSKLKSLGNAIVPQCSEWIGKQILYSGILDI